MSDTDEMDEMKEVIDEFLVESTENLDQLDNDLLALEEDPGNTEMLASIFRTIHTIKGTCGFLGFEKLEKVSHVGENLLSRLRDGTLQLTDERTSALLKMVDAIRQMLASIEEHGNDGSESFQDLIEWLTRLQGDQPNSSLPDTEKPDEKEAVIQEGSTVSRKVVSTEVERPLGEKLVESGSADPEQVARALQKQLEGDERPLGEILVRDVHGIDKEKVEATIQEHHAEQAHARPVTSSNIRVDVELLDQLMNLVGELVLTRNQILQYDNNVADSDMINASQRLSQVTTELQEKVMQARMQPIGSIWSKFPRVVRDLAHGCGKQVRIVMEGKETELDKTIIEAIKDPLTHLVRNSVDHGIEQPQVREKKGKPAEGTLLLRAFHEGGQVNIEICDDGAGIDVDRLKSKALEKKLISDAQAMNMSKREALNLIFHAGLSTAKKVTNISGRGVGMDVVKTNIEKIGGVIDIQSNPGEGTTIKVKIPLTLAIIPALIVLCEDDRYAIPQVNVMELVLLKEEKAKSGIEIIQGVPVYRLRGRLLPLIYLQQVLWGEKREANEGENVNIVVLQAGESQFGLVVNEVEDMQEIVVKPLGKQLKDLVCFAGSTIMGDGRVAMILDVFGLAREAHLVSEMIHEQHAVEQVPQDDAVAGSREMLVLMQNPDGGRIAVPLGEVARLEELPLSAIEPSGKQDVVRYRGQIMPLIDVATALPERRGPSRLRKAADGARSTTAYLQRKDTVQVIVHQHEEGVVGLVVDQIIDVVEENISSQGPSSRLGISGTVVVQNRVTELLDLATLMQMVSEGVDGKSLMRAGA